MIAYLDSSAVVRLYLADEPGRADVLDLIDDHDVGLVTGSWTRVETSGALVRAARDHRGDEQALLALLDEDLSAAGPITVVTAPQEEVEERALAIVRRHGLRAMDAWHLAVAQLTVPLLSEAGEQQLFVSRDEQQRRVAGLLGFVLR